MAKWKMVYAHDCEYQGELKTLEDIEKSGLDIIEATVPGNMEIDLMREGKLDDIYYSVNTLEAQRLEDIHLWYFTKINIESEEQYIHFDGIDTISDIYVNGVLTISTDNMFIGHDIFDNLKIGINEIVVHIKPVCIEARKSPVYASCITQEHNYAGLPVRKAAHMYGWDIMPRIVSAGIWKEVSVRKRKKDSIKEVFLSARSICEKTARMILHVNTFITGAIAQEYSVRITGKCKEHEFCHEFKLWHNSAVSYFDIENPLLWWPKNAGDANLYDICIELYKNGEVCDTYNMRCGIRTVELIRNESNDEGKSEFCFAVNGKKIFVLGTNWVPLDALHSNDEKRLDKALEMLKDIGCNAVRCWGGNVYEQDRFYDFCDENGIMVWQDFSLACGIYPLNDEFSKKMYEEAEYVVKRLRNHCSIVLWTGDNECDMAYALWGINKNPNDNFITRETLARAVSLNDYSRPYLPSSPYISNEAYEKNDFRLPEDHLWGARDYFKSDYYAKSTANFASEMGYHGFPSVKSLKRFLQEPEKIFKEDGNPTEEYLVHSSCMDTNPKNPYAYRIRLAYNQVVTLFGSACDNLSDFVKQSQISQAEADKFFIEHFRIGKWNKTGIIWWNLLDGWPQVSDAVVDYYYNKKLAYSYIKRSQEPVCLMFDEPDENGIIKLFGVCDLPVRTKIKYKVTDVLNDDEVLTGQIVLPKDSSVDISSLSIDENQKTFYLIEWEIDGKLYKNHYFTNLKEIDYLKYMDALKKCGFDDFEDNISELI